MIESSKPASASDVARHYDQLDRFYREIWGQHVHHGLWRTGKESSDQAARNMTNAVIAKLQIQPGMRICDVGCGYGETSRIIAQETGAKVVGLTVSPAQYAYALERSQHADVMADNPAYVLEDWMHNKQGDSSFDRLFAIESTEHMADKRRVFTEAARVLKLGGRMVICAWLAREALKPWEHRHLIEPICREGRMPGLGTESEYRQWMTEAGFLVTEAEDVSSYVSKTWPICAWRFIAGVLCKPAYIRFLLDRKNDNRIFGLTMLRLWIAYQTGAMRYVIFSADREG